MVLAPQAAIFLVFPFRIRNNGASPSPVRPIPMSPFAVPQETSFQDVMGRLRAGDQDAATEVFRRYAGRLIGLARSRLDPLVRRKEDPEDLLQSVFKSFFIRHAEGQWDLGGWDGLWGLLTAITLRKCGRKMVHFRRDRRDVRRETFPAPAGDTSSPVWEAAAEGPTPQEAAMLAETVEHLLSDLSERDRQIVVLDLQGHTAAEVAAQTGCSERTAHRVLDRIRKRLERLRGAQEA